MKGFVDDAGPVAPEQPFAADRRRRWQAGPFRRSWSANSTVLRIIYKPQLVTVVKRGISEIIAT